MDAVSFWKKLIAIPDCGRAGLEVPVAREIPSACCATPPVKLSHLRSGVQPVQVRSPVDRFFCDDFTESGQGVRHGLRAMASGILQPRYSTLLVAAVLLSTWAHLEQAKLR